MKAELERLMNLTDAAHERQVARVVETLRRADESRTEANRRFAAAMLQTWEFPSLPVARTEGTVRTCRSA